MLRLPPFEYLVPQRIDEAVEMLATYKEEAMLVAGGTDVYPGMKRRIFEPKKLISLGKLAELQTFSSGSEGITLGAGMTLTQITSHPLLQNAYPALTAAAGAVSTPQLRNMGTIGGNLCVDTRCTYYNQSESWRAALGYCMKKACPEARGDGHICWVAPGSTRCLAVQSSDTAPVLIALAAKVQLVGPRGTRWLPASALYRNDGIDYLHKQRDEILTQIHVPPAQGIRTTYHKLRRRGSFDFPVLSVAVALRQTADGTCTDVRIVLGAVDSAPIRASEAEALLLDAKINDDLIEEAAHKAFRRARPLDNTDMSISYRKHMSKVYVAKALRETVQMTG